MLSEIAAFAPSIVDGGTSVLASHTSTLAAPIWDVGAQIKNKGITFAVFALMGGSAVLSAWSFFVAKDKTQALKVIGIGVVLAGLVASLPALGVVSKDTVGGLTNQQGQYLQ